MHELSDRNFDSLEVGMHASFRTVFLESDLLVFRDLAIDDAPVHRDKTFAMEMNYLRPIVYGFLVASRFSGLLGMVLPGPRCVIHSSNFKMRKPVFIGDELEYNVCVTRVVKSVKAVVLSLTVTRLPDEIVLRGEAQCGFSR